MIIIDFKKSLNTPVKVPGHGNWRTDMNDVGFLHEDLLRLLAYLSQQYFTKNLPFQELFNATVEVKGRHNFRSRSCERMRNF